MNELHEALKTVEVTVSFTKVNGDQRVMRCTKNFELIPSDKYPQQESLPRAINEDTERVFDTIKQEWRSFRKDSVISWSL